MMRRPSICSLLLASLIAAAGPPARAAAHLGAQQLILGQAEAGLTDNAAFVPPADAAPAHEAFAGVLELDETPMITEPKLLQQPHVLGREVARFPGVRLGFFTVDGDLVPQTQDVIRSGSVGRGTSYWDIIVQPGRVWSEPADQGWSRAAFPFALVHSLENDTHNGLATFLYRHGEVSKVRFQIVQQTAPYYVPDYFVAWGTLAARLDRRPIAAEEALAARYRKSVRQAVRFAPWSDLAAQVGADRIADFDNALPRADGVAAGLDYQGTFYLKYCDSAAGPLPWCDRARFGVWSATKALANETALLRLAQKYGREVFEAKIRDYVPAAAAYPGWRAVRFIDAINMATGVGNGSTRRDPNDIGDGYLDPTYAQWYEAPSGDEKVAALLRSGKVYPWGPGQVARYRDQDMFVLGVAMYQYLKRKEGPHAEIWSMLEKEVYEPIGIAYAPTTRTIESDDRRGQPLMAFGYFPTLGDMVKIARLYQDGGAAKGAQILYRPAIEALSAGEAPRGLPTGVQRKFGETRYFQAFWQTAFQGLGHCTLYVPAMEGWGGDLVVLMPHHLSAVRIAKSPTEHAALAEDPTSMLVVADRLAPFCAR